MKCDDLSNSWPKTWPQQSFSWPDCRTDFNLHPVSNVLKICTSQAIISLFNWLNSQIPEYTCSISHNVPFRTEMCTFLFWMEHCGIWNRCILGFVKLVYCEWMSLMKTSHNSHTCMDYQIYSCVVTGVSCHYGNLRCPRCWQSYQIDDLWFSVR